MGRLVDLSGRQFGRLRVLARAPRGNRVSAGARWLCVCACGNTIIARSDALLVGHIQSCKCLLADSVAARNHRHGQATTPEYRAWKGMLVRCHGEREVDEVSYRGRGIYVCMRWKESVEAFAEDMGRRPPDCTSIDRIDNDGSYTCGKCGDCTTRGAKANCRWATDIQQANNKRNNVLVTCFGEVTTVPNLARRCGVVGAAVIRKRLRRGWSPECAAMTPSKR